MTSARVFVLMASLAGLVAASTPIQTGASEVARPPLAIRLYPIDRRMDGGALVLAKVTNRSKRPLRVDNSWTLGVSYHLTTHPKVPSLVVRGNYGTPAIVTDQLQALSPGESMTCTLSWDDLFQSPAPTTGTISFRLTYDSRMLHQAATQHGAYVTPVSVRSNWVSLLFVKGAVKVRQRFSVAERVVLTSLVSGARLQLENGPHALFPSMTWIRGGHKRRVECPRDLIGKVSIRNSEQALEYVRLFTSGDKLGVFGGRIVEVGGDDESPADVVRLNAAYWKKLKLHHPRVRRVGSRFEISRVMARYPERHLGACQLFKSLEFVTERGDHTILEDGILAEVPALEYPFISLPYH